MIEGPFVSIGIPVLDVGVVGVVDNELPCNVGIPVDVGVVDVGLAINALFG